MTRRLLTIAAAALVQACASTPAPPEPQPEPPPQSSPQSSQQAPATPEARAAMHEMMAAFEAFKGANDARLDEIEKKASADALLEEKVARIDQAVASAQARLDRVVSEGRRPELGLTPVGSAAGRSADPMGEDWRKRRRSTAI